MLLPCLPPSPRLHALTDSSCSGWGWGTTDAWCSSAVLLCRVELPQSGQQEVIEGEEVALICFHLKKSLF